MLFLFIGYGGLGGAGDIGAGDAAGAVGRGPGGLGGGPGGLGGGLGSPGGVGGGMLCNSKMCLDSPVRKYDLKLSFLF